MRDWRSRLAAAAKINYSNGEAGRHEDAESGSAWQHLDTFYLAEAGSLLTQTLSS
jgi:hypothetical protein